MNERFPIGIIYRVNYTANGPTFRGDGLTSTDPITCSKKDIGWKYTFPEIIAGEQQKIETLFLSEQLFKDVLIYDEINRTLKLALPFEKDVSQGLNCPSQSQFDLAFRISSSVLGSSDFNLTVPINPLQPSETGQEITFFEYNITKTRD